ncbi:glycosyltransferase [Peribacillus asahii]|uniref:glycosyltransferase n=1 Tax=Peribacillus asahii TaxID=228899 RepID=UPI0037FF3B5C
MKVLHIINNLGSGGAEKLIEEFLPLMNKVEGIEAEVLLLTNKNNVFDNGLRENFIEVEVIRRKKIGSPLNIFDIRRHIVKGKYDIVHAHLFPTNYWTSIASKLIFNRRPKFVLTEHSTHNRRREKFYFKYIDRFIYSSFDKIISISQKTQENLISWVDPRQKNSVKFIVIENGINLNRFFEAKPYCKSEINRKFNVNSKLLCMVGRFSKQKDQATVIKAMEGLPEDIHLLLIGEGTLKEKDEVLSREIGVQNRVHFLGFRNDVDRIFQTSDIVILSSNWEGFGLVAAEGMAAGKPVLASDVSGLREVVKGAGVLFPKGDSEELARIIKSLIKNQDEYRRISDECLERAKLYNIDKMVKRYLDVYRDL